jgi:hypothetical protein
MNAVLSRYMVETRWPPARERRMVDGLRLLQRIARQGDRPVTYKVFAEGLQKGLAPVATGSILEDIGRFCNAVDWPNVTCFVISGTTGECSDGFTKISSEDPAKARDAAWFRYAVYKTGPLIDGD